MSLAINPVQDTIVDGVVALAPSQNAVFDALALKLNKNAPIAAEVKTKISYSADGLILAGADLDPADLPALIDATKIADGSVNNTRFQYLNDTTGTGALVREQSPTVSDPVITGTIDVTPGGCIFKFSDNPDALSFELSNGTKYLVFSGGESPQLTAKTNTTVDANLNVTGQILVGGEVIAVDQRVSTSDNLLILNFLEVGAGVTNGVAGVEIDRGSSNPYRFLFEESSDTFRVGEYYTDIAYTQTLLTFGFNETIKGSTSNAIGYVESDSGSVLRLKGVAGTFLVGEPITSIAGGIGGTGVVNTITVVNNTQPVATRQDSPVNNAVAVWSSANSRYETYSNLTYNGTSLSVNSAVLSGGTNTLNITNGSASIDISPGAVVDINASLTVPGAATISGTNTGDQTVITGNAGTATTLQTARTIGGVSFNGSSNITVASATNGFAVSGAPITSTAQPAFLAYASTGAANATGDGTFYTVLFDTEIYDQANNYNPATGTFTAPVAGKYRFDFGVLIFDIFSNHTRCDVFLVTSNRTYKAALFNPFATKSSDGYAKMSSSSFLVDMDASDAAYITIGVIGGSKVTGVFGSPNDLWTVFSGNLVC